MATELLYFNDSYQCEGMGRVLEVQEWEDGRMALILDQTIFYPQGGGQPYDLGTMEGVAGEFKVEAVRFKEGRVYHIGHITRGQIVRNDHLSLHVDEDRRRLNARLHSAGHLIDVALENIGQTLQPTKGYHFPDGPYVEYAGTIPEEERDTLKEALETELKRLIQEDGEVFQRLANYEQLPELCGHVPEYIPPDKPCRVVRVAGELGCPCGGTHVKKLSEIGPIRIHKLKSKGGKTRVAYRLD